MAKASKSEKYSKVLLDGEAGTITEFTKEGEQTYCLKDFLARWSGIDGIDISVSFQEELAPIHFE